MRFYYGVGPCVILAALMSAAAFGQAPVSGEKWRQTTTMEMEGMSLPGRTDEVCVPAGKAAEALAGPQDANCSTYDVNQSGNRLTAKVRCTGKDAMEGTLEQVIDGPDRYRSTMKMRSADGEMTLRVASAKLPGACDATAAERRVKALMAKAQQETDKNLAAQCRSSADEIKSKPASVVGGSRMFFPSSKGDAPICNDASQRAAACAALGTRQGFAASRRNEAISVQQGYGLERLLKLCSLGSVEALRTKLVAEAEQEGDWDFLRAEAPQLVDSLVKRECAGRRYSRDIAPRYRTLCSSAATAAAEPPDSGAAAVAGGSDAAATEPSASATTPDQPPGAVGKAKDVTQKAKKALRGIFGGG